MLMKKKMELNQGITREVEKVNFKNKRSILTLKEIKK